MYKAYFFDLDGTLIDSESIWIDAITDALVKRGISVTREEVEAFEVGRSWPDIFRIISERWPQAYSTIDDMSAVTTATYQSVIRIRDIAIHPSMDLLRRLATFGAAIGIVTGSCRERVWQVIQDYGLKDCVRHVISNEDYCNGKPAPDAYLMAAKRSGIPPCDACVFEDAVSGLRAARAAGMAAVGLARTKELAKALAGEADLVLESLADFQLSWRAK